MGRKSLISILIIFSMGNVLAQNIKNFPLEFKNKVFCGETKLNGTNGYSTSVSFLAVPFKLTISDEIIEFSVEYEGSWQVCQTFDKINALFTKSGTDVMYDSFDFSVGVNNESIESQNRKPIMTLKSLSVKVVNPNFVMTPTLMRAGLSAPSKNWITCNIEYGRMSGGHKPLYVENICGEYLTAKARLQAEREESEKQKRLDNEKSIETNKIKARLDDLIKINDFKSAAQIFVLKNITYDISSYSEKIKNGLIATYGRDTFLLDENTSNIIIEKNKEKLKKLNSGDYEYYFDFKGNASSACEITLDPEQVPVKSIGIKGLQLGDRYLGGLVINISDKEIVISSEKPIGFDNFLMAELKSRGYQIDNGSCRLPTPNELESITKLKDIIESQHFTIWTNNQKGPKAETIYVDNGKKSLESKDDFHHFFAVRTISLDNIDIPLNSKLKLSVVENKEKVINTIYYSSSTKPIFKTRSDQYCFKSTDNSSNIPIIVDEKLDKNMVYVEKTLETTKNVNNIVVYREIRYVKSQFQINKKCKSD